MINVCRLAAALVGTAIAMTCLSGTTDAAPVDQDIMLINAKTGKCLTIAGGTLSDNNIPAVQFDCDADSSRRWRLNETSSDRFQIRNLKTGKCLTIAGGISTDNNVTALQFDCDSDPSRTWRFNDVSGSFQIKNVQTEKCLTIAGGTLANNNIEAVQFDCDDDTSRRWTIRTVAAASPQPAQTPAPPPAPAYQTSNWSAWSRADGVEYRYRWGWNPADSRRIDAMFQVRNPQNRVWHGAARSIDCSTNTLSGSVKVDLQPNETRDATFKTPNCGSASSPFFKPNVVQSSTF